MGQTDKNETTAEQCQTSSFDAGLSYVYFFPRWQ